MNMNDVNERFKVILFVILAVLVIIYVIYAIIRGILALITLYKINVRLRAVNATGPHIFVCRRI